MAKSNKRLMGMADVKRLVNRWFDQRVSIESGAMMNTSEGGRNFIEWRNEQTECLDLVYKYQWGRVMFQRGFEKKRDGNDWYFHGIELKNQRQSYRHRRGG